MKYQYIQAVLLFCILESVVLVSALRPGVIPKDLFLFMNAACGAWVVLGPGVSALVAWRARGETSGATRVLVMLTAGIGLDVGVWIASMGTVFLLGGVGFSGASP